MQPAGAELKGRPATPGVGQNSGNTIMLESYAKQAAELGRRYQNNELSSRLWQIRATVLIGNIAEEGEKLLAGAQIEEAG